MLRAIKKRCFNETGENDPVTPKYSVGENGGNQKSKNSWTAIIRLPER
jgi:hypothetical protein